MALAAAALPDVLCPGLVLPQAAQEVLEAPALEILKGRLKRTSGNLPRGGSGWPLEGLG